MNKQKAVFQLHTEQSLNISHSEQNIRQSFISQFENKISANLNKFQQKTIFLAAVSGGADSMALLAAICAIKNNGVIYNNRFYCLHVEHGLRPAEERCGDAVFVKTFCDEHGIECRIKHIKPGKITAYAKQKGIGIEAAARFFRHKALKKEAKRIESLADCSAGKTLVMLAHTNDDLLETILMRILRGSGPAGLALMPSKRGRIIRPLLEMTRLDIIEYLKAKNITWREDSTNTDEVFLRNKIRSRLVQVLNESFPSWKKGVYSMAKTQSYVSEFITGEAGQLVQWEMDILPRIRSCRTRTNSFLQNAHEQNQIVFTDAETLFSQPVIIREEAIFQGINILISLCAANRKFNVLPCEIKRIKSIKRSVIRKFCESKVNTADLGSVLLKHEDGKVIITLPAEDFFECGVSKQIE